MLRSFPPLASVLIACLLAAHDARAVIIYEDPGRRTDLPVLAGGVKPGWQYLGTTTRFAGIPIGPRAWVTATHLNTTTATLNYANAGTTGTIAYASTRAATSGDLAVMVLNDGQPSFTAWAPLWSSTSTLVTGQDVYMFGRGTQRGTEVFLSGTRTGWNWGTDDGNASPVSYGTNELAFLATSGTSILLAMDFDQPTVQNGLPGTECVFSYGDSGGAVFSFDPVDNRWELLGVNTSVDVVRPAPNVDYLRAVLYDTRGYYYYQGPLNNQLITGTAPVPVASYSTSIPHKYSFLVPFTVPEPDGLALACVAGPALLAFLRLRPSRR